MNIQCTSKEVFHVKYGDTIGFHPESRIQLKPVNLYKTRLV